MDVQEPRHVVHTIIDDLAGIREQLAHSAFSGHRLLGDQARTIDDVPLATLTLVTASMGTYRSQELIPVAVALELLHLAACAHYQRGGTGDARESGLNKNLYLISADYYYAQAIRIASDLDDGVVIEHMVQAIADIASEYAVLRPPHNGTRPARGRRASLFAAAVALGARLSGCSAEQAGMLRRFAESLSYIREAAHGHAGGAAGANGDAVAGARESMLASVEALPSPQALFLKELLS